MDKQKIIESYKVKILGIRNYKHPKNEFFLDDFLKLKILDDFLAEVDSGESDITPAGKAFLETYYGMDQLVLLLTDSIPTESNRNHYKEYIAKVLKYLSPMETKTFIEKARGNIGENFTLREDLLPPKIED